jgi:hypothetical protein
VEEVFGSAYNWCDSWCERCPLKATCEVALQTARRRWVHEARGEDPDDMGVVLADVADDLERALTMLQDYAREEGIDLDDPERQMPLPSIATQRLQRTGLDFATIAHDAVHALEPAFADANDPEVGELLFQAIVIARKCARLAGYMDPRGMPAEDDVVWRSDAVPNLLLMEIVTGRARDAFRVLFDAELAGEFAKLQATLDRSLVELYRAVPSSARSELALMIEARRAPSPFCIEEIAP